MEQRKSFIIVGNFLISEKKRQIFIRYFCQFFVLYISENKTSFSISVV